jgi:hypothetical protein
MGNALCNKTFGRKLALPKQNPCPTDGKERKSSAMETPSPHPEPENPIRAPFIPLSASRKLIATLGWCIVGLVIITTMLTIGFVTSINRKPWILVNTGNGYQEMEIGRPKVTRGDIARYLNFVIPNIYGSLNGEAPGLASLRGLVNENIISKEKKTLEDKQRYFKENGISQFAVVTGLNPDTLVINRERHLAYAEALGSVVLSKENKSQKTDTQWRCLMYIVEPTDALNSTTPAGKMTGNRMGLFLQYCVEQEVGTVNKDSPKPSASDLQEKQTEETKK